MAGRKTDWEAVVFRINKWYGAKFAKTDLRNALKYCLNRNDGSAEMSRRVVRTSYETLTHKLSSLKLKWRTELGKKRDPKRDISAAADIRASRIEVVFNKEAWIADGKRRSPCHFCSNKGGDKTNWTCVQECPATIEYDRIMGSPLSKLGIDSISTTTIQGIGHYSCGR